IIILDHDGNRIMAKYYNQSFSSVKEQKEFEKSLFNKTHKGAGDVILLNNMTIVYRNNVDLLFYVMGSTDENELMLNTVLSCLYESLSTMLKKNVEKRLIYDNLDLVMLTIDEICDEGIILESDPIMIIQRVLLRQDDVSFGEQTVSQTLSTLSVFHPAFEMTDKPIDVVFTFTNANTHMENKFRTMITSLLKYSSGPLNLHVIGDNKSRLFVNQTLDNINTHALFKLNEIDINNVSNMKSVIIKKFMNYFSSQHKYYKDPLFFLSIVLHEIFPDSIKHVIMLDVDIKIRSDIFELYKLFNNFNETNIIGIARENQPVYRHLLYRYRQENPDTIIGGPPPYGLTGFNSGVLLLNLEKIRLSTLYNSYLSTIDDQIQFLIDKYYFVNSHLGDQDFYTLLSFEHPELFYILKCNWNRQLCSWWKDKGYEIVWNEYYDCNEKQIHIYHGNCNTQFPQDAYKDEL
ncbi:unnamed protein product, partial [Didymodactylos carnosus]